VIKAPTWKIAIPWGNQLFLDLVKAIFELEEKLARLLPRTAYVTVTRKAPSQVPVELDLHLHCTINRHVEFTPRVYSGWGRVSANPFSSA
jgi:hypothetical protein